MKPADAAREIRKLMEELRSHGGQNPSQDLLSFLDELDVTAGLKAVRKSASPKAGSSGTKPPRVGGRPKRPPEADMSKTIEELAARLREAFHSDERFEKVLTEPTTQQLSKSNVVNLYNRVFEQPRPLPKALTKPEVFNAIRRERISRVRSGY